MNRGVWAGAACAAMVSGSAIAGPTNEEVLAELRALRAEVGQLRQQAQRDRAELSRLRAGRQTSIVRAPATSVVSAQPETIVGVAPPPNWTGFYAGAAIGALVPDIQLRETSGSRFSQTNPGTFFSSSFSSESEAFGRGRNVSEVAGAVTLLGGYSAQLSPFLVAGLQAEGSVFNLIADQRTTTTIFSRSTFQSTFVPFFGPPQTTTGTTHNRPVTLLGREELRALWSASALGRLGVLPSPNVLLYAIGGWTAAKFETAIGNQNIRRDSRMVIFDGPTIGGGVEVKLNRDWTATAEYRFTSLRPRRYLQDTSSPFLDSPNTTLTAFEATKIRGELHSARIGVTRYFD